MEGGIGVGSSGRSCGWSGSGYSVDIFWFFVLFLVLCVFVRFVFGFRTDSVVYFSFV